MTFFTQKLSNQKILLHLQYQNKYHETDKTNIARQNSHSNRAK